MAPASSTASSHRAFERIYREHYRRVRWAARAHGVSEDSLDDVVHDVFLSVFRRISRRDPTIPMATWVIGVARSVAFSHRRASLRRERRHAVVEPPARALGPDEQIERKQAWAALAGFLDALPDSQREVFILSELMGLSVAEIAKTAKSKSNTLYSRLRLARRRFARWFPEARDPEAARRLLRQAGQQERPSPSMRRESWAMLATQLGELSPIAASGAATTSSVVSGKAVALVVVGAVGIVLGVTKIDKTPTPSRRVSRSVSIEPASSGSSSSVTPAAAAAAAAALHVPAPDPVVIVPPSRPALPARRPVTLGARRGATTPDRSLDAEVALLLDARERLSRGRAADALRLVDRHDREFSNGVLVSERQRIEREAACRLGDEARARQAAGSLPPDVDPCAESLGPKASGAAPVERAQRPNDN